MIQFNQRENRFRHSSKALVEKCGNAGMTCVERGAVMPLMFRLPKGESSLICQQDSLEPRVAQKRVGWDKPPSFKRGVHDQVLFGCLDCSELGSTMPIGVAALAPRAENVVGVEVAR